MIVATQHQIHFFVKLTGTYHIIGKAHVRQSNDHIALAAFWRS
jgi:hypothetical protein